MKVNRRHFVGILYDCILFEYASLVPANTTYTLSLDDLADTFAFIADFYKHNRALVNVPCDQFITRNQLHTVTGLVDYIEDLGNGAFEIFPHGIELREESPSFSSSTPMNQDQRQKDQSGKIGFHGSHEVDFSHDWTVTDISTHRSRDPLYDPEDFDDEYCLVIPGLSKTDVQTFLWEYAYVPEVYQDDIATLIRYLRRDEWMMHGSKGSVIKFDWDLEGVQKYSKNYNQNKILKVELREQDEAKKAREAVQKQQEEWNRQQELIREQEAAHRMKILDNFIWKMHESLSLTSTELSIIDKLIKNLEVEISGAFGFCFVALAAVGSYATGTFTHHSDLDLTLTGNIKDITTTGLVETLRSIGFEEITISIDTTRHSSSPMGPIPPSIITFIDPVTATTCHLTLNEQITIQRSKLIRTYALIDQRFGSVLVALKQLAFQRNLVTGSIHQDRDSHVPLGSYAMALMLVTYFQTENPPILPRLQQTSSLEGNDRPVKETTIQGVDCSFSQEWRFYQGFGAKNTKSAAELLMEFCRFFGYVFDYGSKEVNARVGAFRWRSTPSKFHTNTGTMKIAATPSSTVSEPSSSPLTITSTSTSSTPSQIDTRNNTTATLYVMDPFVIGFNITSECHGELVRTVKECFQETYEAFIDGDINLAFSGP